MIVLLTNDDGIKAEGLAALRAALPRDITCRVAAPMTPMSQCGHRVTTDSPLRVEAVDASAFAIDGTPADCVRLALCALFDETPDLVLSGINHGGNLGADIYISGTVAAAREAAFHGVPAIAVSHYHNHSLKRGYDWEWAAQRVRELIDRIRAASMATGEYWNINLPHTAEAGHIPDTAFCPPSRYPLPVDFHRREDGSYHYSGVYSDRGREPGSDVDICFGGRISISKLHLG